MKLRYLRRDIARNNRINSIEPARHIRAGSFCKLVLYLAILLDRVAIIC